MFVGTAVFSKGHLAVVWFRLDVNNLLIHINFLLFRFLNLWNYSFRFRDGYNNLTFRFLTLLFTFLSLPFALLAFAVSILRMHEVVGTKSTLLCKSLVAYLTNVILLPSVGQIMLPQRDFLHEPSLADVAHMRFLTSVNQAVLSQRTLIREASIANITDMGLVSGVDQVMGLKATFLSKPLVAHITYVGFFSSVPSVMGSQIAL